MKRFLFAFTLAFAFATAFAQTTNEGETYQYTEVLDDPNHVADKIISGEFCGPLTFSSKGELTLGIGFNALWGFGPALQAQAGLDLNFIQMNGGMGLKFELGPALTFSQSTKEKEAKVVLKYSDRSYETATTRVRETSATWLNVTASYLTRMKLRGGYYLLRTSWEDEKTNYGKLPYTMTGVYAGIEWSRQAALISEVDGKRGITSGLSRVYADAFILPVRTFGAADVGGAIRSAVGGGIFGGRLGFQAFFNPNKSRRSSYGKLYDYQVYPKFCFKTELGYRPAEGLYWTLGGGMILWKNR